MTYGGIDKLGRDWTQVSATRSREDGSGTSRCRYTEQMQHHQGLIHSVRYVTKICFQI